MRSSLITPNLHLKQLNEHLANDAKNNLQVPKEFSIELCSLHKKGKSQISGIVSAFGLGGCNATAVLQAKVVAAQARKTDSKKTSLQIATWVQASNTSTRMMPAILVGGSASPVQIQSRSDVRSGPLLNSIFEKQVGKSVIIQCSDLHEI